LLTLREAGCRLFLWSTGGAEYCRQVAERYEMTPLFEAFLPKPDLFILSAGVLAVAKDLPATTPRSFAAQSTAPLRMTV
jgi:hypothetical protein